MTVVPQSPSLMCSGTCDERWNRGVASRPRAMKRFLSLEALWLTQVLASGRSPEQAQVPSADTFLTKMRRVQGLIRSEAEEYQDMTVIWI